MALPLLAGRAPILTVAVVFCMAACTQPVNSEHPRTSPTFRPITPSASGSLERCRASNLQLGLLGIYGSPGMADADFEYRNNGGTACVIKGFVSVILIGQMGQVIPSSAIDDPGLPPVDVVLPSATQPIPSTRGAFGIPGHARFDMVWGNQCTTGTSLVVSLRVTPPDNNDFTVVTLKQPAKICDAKFTLYPVRSTTA